ncbi:MAG: DnaJ domain-containing protein [Polyangiaceae bacterium]|jgi:DnaJ-domain-containing protein 1
MQLPGRLRSTTLGDVLGMLYRASANGTLELVEARGRCHRVHLVDGCVVGAEIDGASRSLAEILRSDRAADDDTIARSLLRSMTSHRLHGQVLVEDFRLNPSLVAEALRRQVQERLAFLDCLEDARLSFRVAVRRPREVVEGVPLGAGAFLHGRRRARDRDRSQPPHRATDGAWTVLGIDPGSDVHEIKRAYRRLARSLHPDLHPDVTGMARRDLEVEFARVTHAYRTLVA